MADAPRTLTSLDEIAAPYAAILSDVWGVLHNGIVPHPAAVAALRRMRAQGRAVVLITNAPRPSAPIIAQLDRIGVDRDCWDRLVTSGDVTRRLIAEGARRIFHIGPDDDLSIYEGLDVELVEEFEADAVVCTGLFDDETERPEDYAELLMRLRARNLPFICANPDIVVERGDRLIWCAGALARDYGQLGGRTLIAGKPFAPIYEAALEAASDVLGREVGAADVLAIGDGALTDLKGAAARGIDMLFITAGIHAAEYGPPHAPDLGQLARFLGRHGPAPAAVMPHLA
ncbi:MAG: TIGR01459 family HAD-type hydrolase [Rhizobiales bacterium]|nr:TIGR01459 family HAD-type hydrolase [Hyphomicrobiales bacterium]OJU34117.1 MAG: HAD family hydrolase [Rhizobiales bacterium 68-8]